MKVKYVRRVFSAVVIGLTALLVIATGVAAQTPNLIQNGEFNGNLNGWIVNPVLQTGTSPWSPLLADGSGVSLQPDSYSFNGTILYQNLNLTNVAGKTLSLSVKLTNVYEYTTGNTVTVWLTYADGSGNPVRTMVLNPANSDITAGTVVTGSFLVPPGAQKIVKIELVKGEYGYFNADDVILWADDITTGATPALSGLSVPSGAYGATLTITGSGFGTTTGKVTVGGVPVAVTSWSDTAINVSVASPMRSGNVVVIAGGVESNPSQPFIITSPYFATTLLATDVKVIQGQTAEFLIDTSFYNGFTTVAGITLQLQGGNVATLTGKTTFTPIPIKAAGGVVLKIDTKDMSAGTYKADIVAINGSETVPVGTLNLKVVTVSNIKFYEMVAQTYPDPSIRVDLTAKTVSSQGQIYLYTEVTGSDDLIITESMSIMAGAGTGVVLTEVSASYPILGIYNRFWGYDLYAQANGTTTLRATTPDGTFFDLPITVNFPSGATDSYISGIGFAAPEGAPPVYPTIYNNRTAPLTWYASGTTRLGSIGYDTAGMWNFQIDFFDKLNRSSDGLSASSTFTLKNLPVDIGTAILHAQTSDGKATAVVPLTTVNAPGTGLLSFYIRSLDPDAFAEMFKLYFYGASDNQLKFTRDVYAMHIGSKPVLVGNIPPGNYKILFTPGNVSVKPQWWPNAAEISGATAVNFTADTTAGDIYFFVGSQSTYTAVTLPTPASHDFTSTQAGTGSVAFTAGNGYVWSAQSSAPWITITSGVTGIGSGTVTYTVATNPYSFSRTGTILIGGKSYTIIQAGTRVVPRHVGTWGAQQLTHFDTGYDLAGDVSVPWYAEVSRTTFNEDGTGTMVIKKNKHNGEVKEQTTPFTYTKAPNADGSMNMAITMTVDGVTYTDTARMVISDDGQMGFVDGTAKDHQQKLMVLYRIDPTKTYSAADLSGQYYNLGFERNETNVADPPLSGNGAFMAISGIHSFAGNGTYTYDAYANSVKIDGSNLIWHDDQTNVVRNYGVAADGTMTAGSGAFQGYFTGNGLVGGGGGAFINGVNNQLAYFFLKKGDRPYLTADLAGRWALVSLGQDSKTTDPKIEGFYSSFGTMICDTLGNCSVKVKDRNSDNSTAITADNMKMAVSADGSFGTSFGGQSPFYAGAIGNNGNTILINPSLYYASGDDPWNREIVLGIRASNVGDLAGGTAILKGDINDDGMVDLADAVLALKIMAGINVTIRPIYPASGTDVNGDGKVSHQELLYILQDTSGLRQ